MAHPHHVPTLDDFDRLTVRLYRTGLALASLGVAALGAALALDVSLTAARVLLLVGVALAVVDMHLYDKRIRWVIAVLAQLGGVFLVSGALLGVELLVWAGTGFLFATLSAFALKEQFCFKIPGLRAVPAVLALALIPAVLEMGRLSGAMLVLCTLPLGLLVVAKSRMPLHFDVGDRSAYQI